MKKFLLVVIILILMFGLGIILGKAMLKLDTKNNLNDIESVLTDKNQQENNENENTSYIIQKKEIISMGLYQIPGQIYTSSEDDLMLNDMKLDSGVNLYYKVITSMEDYNKYYERGLEIPKLTGEDFNNCFLIIIANEMNRPESEKDLEISKITTINDTMNIILKQRENPNLAGQENNIFWALVSIEMLKSNVIINIKK